MKRFEHGGDVWHGNPSEWVDFSSNINMLGCPDFVERALSEAMQEVSFYPQVDMELAIDGLSQMLDVASERILPTNGGIAALDLAITKLRPARVVVVSPTFVEYERIAVVHDIDFVDISMIKGRREIAFPMAELMDEIKRDDMLIICNPSNPTGFGVEQDAMRKVLDLTVEKGAMLLVDEAFVDFCDGLSVRDEISRYANLIIAGSLTKMFAVPGVRLGYLLG
ncbi:MAG: aminotransferase class I/II-fold pyridoxal phosphate-dependent enzyme, partial [Clostridia bacterium]|nr:aminotransferase class I/II-fold pyridoxal phosphate-dependent enzyme [Clostridia bacterium]